MVCTGCSYLKARDQISKRLANQESRAGVQELRETVRDRDLTF